MVVAKVLCTCKGVSGMQGLHLSMLYLFTKFDEFLLKMTESFEDASVLFALCRCARFAHGGNSSHSLSSVFMLFKKYLSKSEIK